MTTTVRPAAPGDEQQLVALNQFVQDLHITHRPEHFKPTDPLELTHWFQQTLNNFLAHTWIAEANNTPLGYILCFIRETPETPFCFPRRYFEIDQLCVSPTSRNQGIARQLLQTAITHAQTSGFTQIEATSWAFNKTTHHIFQRHSLHPKQTRFELRP